MSNHLNEVLDFHRFVEEDFTAELDELVSFDEINESDVGMGEGEMVMMDFDHEEMCFLSADNVSKMNARVEPDVTISPPSKRRKISSPNTPSSSKAPTSPRSTIETFLIPSDFAYGLSLQQPSLEEQYMQLAENLDKSGRRSEMTRSEIFMFTTVNIANNDGFRPIFGSPSALRSHLEASKSLQMLRESMRLV